MIWFRHLISRLSLGLLQSCWSCGHVCGGINKKGHKTKSFIPKSCKNRFKDLDDIWNILISSPTLYFPYCITFSLLSCTSPRFFLVISCGNIGTERNEHKDAPWDKTGDDTILPGNFNCFDNSSQASEGQVQQCSWQ